MRMLLSIALGTVVAGGCATPMERVEAICNRLGDPTPACVERLFNIERAREDAFVQQYKRTEDPASYNSGPSPSPPQPPTESEYDRRNRELKENCVYIGGRYLPNLNAGEGGCILRIGSINHLSGESTRENRSPSGRSAAGDRPTGERIEGRTRARRCNFRGVLGVGLPSARQFLCRSHERLGIRVERVRRSA